MYVGTKWAVWPPKYIDTSYQICGFEPIALRTWWAVWAPKNIVLQLYKYTSDDGFWEHLNMPLLTWNT